jgi:hypothetical protein
VTVAVPIAITFAPKTNSIFPHQKSHVAKSRASAPTGGSAMHVFVLTSHEDEESRLYWIFQSVETNSVNSNINSADNHCMSKSLELQHTVWLNRFVSPESVAVAGWLVADNGVAYGAISQDPSLPAIVMALDADGTLALYGSG